MLGIAREPESPARESGTDAADAGHPRRRPRDREGRDQQLAPSPRAVATSHIAGGRPHLSPTREAGAPNPRAGSHGTDSRLPSDCLLLDDVVHSVARQPRATRVDGCITARVLERERGRQHVRAPRTRNSHVHVVS